MQTTGVSTNTQGASGVTGDPSARGSASAAAASGAGTGTGGAATGGAAAAASPMLSPDFETFLKMLTTQMKNQDPLNPMDSADYAVQLATFSGVEQQMKSNQLLAGLSSQMGAMGMAQLAGWVGMEARTTQPVWFGGSPLSLSIPAQPGAERAVLVVQDAAGAEVARSETPTAGGEVSWAGTTKNGTPLAAGSYRFTLETYRGGSLTGTQSVAAYGKIVEARAGENGPVLLLEGGAQVAATDVGAVRSPG